MARKLVLASDVLVAGEPEIDSPMAIAPMERIARRGEELPKELEHLRKDYERDGLLVEEHLLPSEEEEQYGLMSQTMVAYLAAKRQQEADLSRDQVRELDIAAARAHTMAMRSTPMGPAATGGMPRDHRATAMGGLLRDRQSPVQESPGQPKASSQDKK